MIEMNYPLGTYVRLHRAVGRAEIMPQAEGVVRGYADVWEGPVEPGDVPRRLLVVEVNPWDRGEHYGLTHRLFLVHPDSLDPEDDEHAAENERYGAVCDVCGEGGPLHDHPEEWDWLAEQADPEDDPHGSGLIRQWDHP